MLGKLLGGVISKIVGEGAGTKVVEYFDNKQKLKHERKLVRLNGKLEVERAKWQRKAEQLRQHGKWSEGMVDQMAGWKDEFVLVVVSAPYIRAFIEAPDTLTMFETLQKTPQWYVYLLLTIFLAIYGLKPAFQKLGFWRK